MNEFSTVNNMNNAKTNAEIENNYNSHGKNDIEMNHDGKNKDDSLKPKPPYYKHYDADASDYGGYKNAPKWVTKKSYSINEGPETNGKIVEKFDDLLSEYLETGKMPSEYSNEFENDDYKENHNCINNDDIGEI